MPNNKISISFLVFLCSAFVTSGQITTTSPITGGPIPGGPGSIGLDPAYTLPAAGTAGRTLYDNGSTWSASSNLYHDGTVLGIGTTTPSAMCEIKYNSTGNVFNGYATPYGGLTITENVTACDYSDGNGNNIPCNPNPYLLIRDELNNGATYNTNLVYTHYHTLGINTGLPVAALDVRNTYSNSPIAFFSTSNGTSSNTGSFEVNQPSSTLWSGTFYNVAGAGKGIRIKGGFYNDPVPLLQVEANNSSGGDYDIGNTRFVVYANGTVGIGTLLTNNPNNYLLAVNGTIGAKGIQIENSSTTWPDYVFGERYKLMPLKTLESYIASNKHLPGMPTATEVKEKGIDLAQTETELVKKVEELTLYTIQLQKQNEELQNRMQTLEKSQQKVK